MRVTDLHFDDSASHRNWGSKMLLSEICGRFYIEADERVVPKLPGSNNKAVIDAGKRAMFRVWRRDYLVGLHCTSAR